MPLCPIISPAAAKNAAPTASRTVRPSPGLSPSSRLMPETPVVTTVIALPTPRRRGQVCAKSRSAVTRALVGCGGG